MPSSVDLNSPAGGMFAEFDSPTSLGEAIAALQRSGWQVVECYTPFDLDAGDAARPPRARSPLPAVGLAGGIAGAIGAFLVEWWTNARSYPINVGGRPRPAIPAYIPIVFESMVLVSALSLVAAWLIILGLPRLWAPVDEVPGFERTSLDRFWAECIPPGNTAAAEALLRALGAVQIMPVVRSR